jgi:hypothetical protein
MTDEQREPQMDVYEVHKIGERYAVLRGDDVCATFATQELALFCVQLLTGEQE